MMVTNSGPPQTQQFTVSGQVNGQTEDLTTQVLYAVSPSGVVTIDKNGLATSTGTRGGVVTVTASSGAVSTTATLTVYYTFTGADPGMTGLPTDPSSIFTTTNNDTTRSPGLVYPNDGVLFPPNITGIEIHFTPGANNTLFEVSLAGKYATVNAFVRCVAMGTSGCIYQPDPGLWSAISTGNAGQGDVSLVVRGTDDSGTSVGDSSPFHMQFSKDNIDGALYYWTTSGSSAIMRWDFSGTTQSAQAYLTPANTKVTSCIGCHALAPDGSKMVVSANGQGDGRLLLWDIANNKALVPYPLAVRSQFESWNSDGTQFVGVFGDNQNTRTYAKAGPVNLTIFSGLTGAMTGSIDLGGARGDHPDWSKSTDAPNTIVFTSADPTAATSDQRPATGGIDYVQYDGAAWGAPQTLVPSVLGKNRYYPAIAPDGDLVVYDESTCTAVADGSGHGAGQVVRRRHRRDGDDVPDLDLQRRQRADRAHQRQQTWRRRRRDDRAHQLVPKVGPLHREAHRAAAAGLVDLLLDPAVRACARRPPRRPAATRPRSGRWSGWSGSSPASAVAIRATRRFASRSRTSRPRTTSPSGRSTSSWARARRALP